VARPIRTPSWGSPVAESVIEAVNARLPVVAAEESVGFVDTLAAMNRAALFGADGFHPTQAGSLLDAIEPSLIRVLAGAR
jgi:hypothetical protein